VKDLGDENDSDDEDQKKKKPPKTVKSMNARDIQGQEKTGAEYDDGQKLEPFNMNEELEEGYLYHPTYPNIHTPLSTPSALHPPTHPPSHSLIPLTLTLTPPPNCWHLLRTLDETGFYTFQKSATDSHDVWLDSVTDADIEKAKESHDRQLAKAAAKAAKPQGKIQLLKQVISLLEPGETTLQVCVCWCPVPLSSLSISSYVVCIGTEATGRRNEENRDEETEFEGSRACKAIVISSHTRTLPLCSSHFQTKEEEAEKKAKFERLTDASSTLLEYGFTGTPIIFFLLFFLFSDPTESPKQNPHPKRSAFCQRKRWKRFLPLNHSQGRGGSRLVRSRMTQGTMMTLPANPKTEESQVEGKEVLRPPQARQSHGGTSGSRRRRCLGPTPPSR